MGTRDLYDWVDDNPAVVMMDIAYVNNTEVIARNPRMTALNSAIEVRPLHTRLPSPLRPPRVHALHAHVARPSFTATSQITVVIHNQRSPRCLTALHQ